MFGYCSFICSRCDLIRIKLASIHDDDERRFLASVDEWDGDSWIGLKRNDQGGFEWIDNSPLDYTSWADGEPNNGG